MCSEPGEEIRQMPVCPEQGIGPQARLCVHSAQQLEGPPLGRFSSPEGVAPYSCTSFLAVVSCQEI